MAGPISRIFKHVRPSFALPQRSSRCQRPRNGSPKTKMSQIMAARQRKTLVLYRTCHHDVHAGRPMKRLSSLLCQARFDTLGCSSTRLLVKWIQPCQFDARICGGEVPLDCRAGLIACPLPLFHLFTELLHGGDVMRQALAHQHREFNLSDIQPTGMDAACSGSPADPLGPWPLREGRPHTRKRANAY
jgi:hypothetical protein